MATVPRWRFAWGWRAAGISCLLIMFLTQSLRAESSRDARPSDRVGHGVSNASSPDGPSPEMRRGSGAGRVPLSPPRERSPKSTGRWSLSGDQRSLALRGVLVVGGIAAWCFWYRSFARRSGQQGADGVIQVYGKVALDPKQQLHFVRIGRRLLVLVQGPQGVQHVTEFEDPEEVQRILTHWQPDKGIKLSGGMRAELAAHASRYAAEWDDNAPSHASSHDGRLSDLRGTRASRDLHLSQFRNS